MDTGVLARVTVTAICLLAVVGVSLPEVRAQDGQMRIERGSPFTKVLARGVRAACSRFPVCSCVAKGTFQTVRSFRRVCVEMPYVPQCSMNPGANQCPNTSCRRYEWRLTSTRDELLTKWLDECNPIGPATPVY